MRIRKNLYIIIILPFLLCMEVRYIYQMSALVEEQHRFQCFKEFRQNPESILACKNREPYIQQYRSIYEGINEEIQCFPVGKAYMQEVQFDDNYGFTRTYGGERIHQGIDIFPGEGIETGEIPIVSATDGIVTAMGWLELGGWRIGITSKNGNYYYYAHLQSYAQGLQVGDSVRAGEFIGFMGDSGYGEEGTVGQFPVHLHFGIYSIVHHGEVSINPYCYLVKLL